MKVQHTASLDEISLRRKEAYLKMWPIERQLEALTEAQEGRCEKLERLREDFLKIKDMFPKEAVKEVRK